MLRPDPAQQPRLEAVIASLTERIAEATEHGWLGDLLRGLGLGIGRRLAWIPLVAFAWRIRFVVGAVAVVQETIAGRPAFAAIIAIFITLTYLTPASRRGWEKHLEAAAGGHRPEPVSRAG